MSIVSPTKKHANACDETGRERQALDSLKQDLVRATCDWIARRWGGYLHVDDTAVKVSVCMVHMAGRMAYR